MLFAAGFGTRMKALTKDRPKPLIKVAGKPLFDHAWDHIKDADFDTIVANIHYFPKMMAAHLDARGISVSDETDHILETGGGLKKALSQLGSDPVLTMNTDAVWRGANPVLSMRAAWNPDEMDALLLLVHPDRCFGHTGGDFEIDAEGRLRRGGPFVYSGLQIIKTDGLTEITDSKFSISRLWEGFQQEQRLFGLVYEGAWCDVGHPEGIQIAEDMLRK